MFYWDFHRTACNFGELGPILRYRENPSSYVPNCMFVLVLTMGSGVIAGAGESLPSAISPGAHHTVYNGRVHGICQYYGMLPSPQTKGGIAVYFYTFPV